MPSPCGRDSTSRLQNLRHLWLAGVVLYAGIVAYIGWGPLREALSSLRVVPIGAMAASMAAALWLRALKWRWMLGPGRRAAGLFFLSKAAGGYSPARLGELAPLLLRGHRSPRLAAWIVLDRLLETGATVGLGIAGCIVLGTGEGSAGLRATGIFLAAMAALVIAPYYLLTRSALFVRVARFMPEGSRRQRFILALASVTEEVGAFRARLPAAAAWSVACTALDLVAGLMLYAGFGYAVSFSLLAVVQCAHGLVSALPFLPNATGGPYLVAAGLLYELGGLPEHVLAAAVGINVALSNVLFWLSFVFGAATLSPGGRKFRGQADLFDYLASGAGLYRYSPDSLARLDELIDRKGRVLDLGCGDGAIGGALTAGSVFAADISLRCASLAAGHGLRAVVADARAGLPFCEHAFDTVYCVDVLHHLPGTWKEVLAEAGRVLRPGGRLVAVEPDARYALVRWTQGPRSLIRVAPCDNEPAIYASELMPLMTACGFDGEIRPIRIDGEQINRNVFPLWQRILKAPCVFVLSMLHGNKPNKFAIIARKREA